MKLIDKCDYLTRFDNKLFLTFDSIQNERDVDEAFQLFLSKGYNLRGILIELDHDHTELSPKAFAYDRYDAFLEAVKTIGYQNIASISGTLWKDASFVWVNMTETRMIASWKPGEKRAGFDDA